MNPPLKPDTKPSLELRLGQKKPCKHCKKGFVPKTKRQDYCTDKCRYRHRDNKPERREYDRQRHRESYAARRPEDALPRWPKARAEFLGVAYEQVEREEIYIRDNWTCGICGKKVNKTLVYPDPQCASLDHIIPWSAGGDHLATNLQCTHLVCNLRKSKKLPEELLATGQVGILK